MVAAPVRPLVSVWRMSVLAEARMGGSGRSCARSTGSTMATGTKGKTDVTQSNRIFSSRAWRLHGAQRPMAGYRPRPGSGAVQGRAGRHSRPAGRQPPRTSLRVLRSAGHGRARHVPAHRPTQLPGSLTRERCPQLLNTPDPQAQCLAWTQRPQTNRLHVPAAGWPPSGRRWSSYRCAAMFSRYLECERCEIASSVARKLNTGGMIHLAAIDLMSRRLTGESTPTWARHLTSPINQALQDRTPGQLRQAVGRRGCRFLVTTEQEPVRASSPGREASVARSQRKAADCSALDWSISGGTAARSPSTA
jgi:hypothetical protein